MVDGGADVVGAHEERVEILVRERKRGNARGLSEQRRRKNVHEYEGGVQ